VWYLSRNRRNGAYYGGNWASDSPAKCAILLDTFRQKTQRTDLDAETIQGFDGARILALAIQNEEEDGRIYGEFATRCGKAIPQLRICSKKCARRKLDTDRLLISLENDLGAHSADPAGKREGILHRKPLWLVRPLGVNAARKHARMMEMEAVRFYQRAADRVTHAGTRELLNRLADEERSTRKQRGTSKRSI